LALTKDPSPHPQASQKQHHPPAYAPHPTNCHQTVQDNAA
jgi:hypothetical protein